MSRSLAEAVRLQLAGAPQIEPVAISSLREAPSVGASEVLEGRFSLQGGRLHVDAALEDAVRERHVESLSASGPASGGPLPLAEAIARQIDPRARPLPTDNLRAFRAYIDAIEASDPAAADAGFDVAAGADPDFGAVYLAWAQSLIARGDRTRAVRVLAAAREKAPHFQEIERVRLDLTASALAQDRAGERRALVALTHADPADAAVYSRLSALDAAAHSYRGAAVYCDMAFQREPAEILLLNQAGYLRAWAGDLDGAVKAIERYRSLRPAEANPLDSLGDVYYWFGRFAEAEKAYGEAYSKDSSFLGGGEPYKVAWARLMQGDRKGADAALGQFLQARKSAADPLVNYRQAQWEYLTGRRREALGRLEGFARTARPAEAAVSYAQLAIWAVEGRDRQRASAYAAKAPGPLPVAVLARFLAQPAAPAGEWRARASAAFPEPAEAGLRRLALSSALLLSQQFAAAIGPLEETYNVTDPEAPDWPAVSLAWALVETGNLDRAAPLVSGNQVPDPVTDNPLRSLVFPRVFSVRAALERKQGRGDAAEADLRLFLRYSGDPEPR